MTRDELIALARKLGAPEPMTMKEVFLADGQFLEAFADALSSATPAGGGQNPTINYEPLHAFALDNRVSYNELCAAVRKAIALAASPVPMASGAGEPVATVADNPFCPEGTSDVLDRYLPTGTELYLAPPAASVREQDAKDAARYRWLRANTKEEPLRPAAYGSELAPDMRLKHSFPTLVSYDAIGQQISLDAAIDAALSSDTQEGSANG